MCLHFAAELVLELVCKRFPEIIKVGAHIAQDKSRIDFEWNQNITPFISSLQSGAQSIIDSNQEIISAFSDEYNERSDVWSLGVIAYFYLTGKFPFFDESKEELKNLIEKYEPNFENEDWENYSEEAKNFCICLLCKAPESRPSCEEALNHKWFQIAS